MLCKSTKYWCLHLSGVYLYNELRNINHVRVTNSKMNNRAIVCPAQLALPVLF